MLNDVLLLQAWVHLKGFVETEMQEILLWIRISAILQMSILAVVSSSFCFRYYSSDYRGQPFLMIAWAIVTEAIQHFSYDRLQTSDQFKLAAAHYGYSGLSKLHDGAFQRKVVQALTMAAAFPLMLFLFVTGQHAELYTILYAIFGYSVVISALNVRSHYLCTLKDNTTDRNNRIHSSRSSLSTTDKMEAGLSPYRWSLATKPAQSVKILGNLCIRLTFTLTFLLPEASIGFYVKLGMLLMFLSCFLWGLVVTCGYKARADEALLLQAFIQGYSIGGGLIYSTADVLNALLFDEPVPMGYIATRARIMQCAALSLRWDTHTTDLKIKERSGFRIAKVHVSRAQLLRAAEAAHEAGCAFLWCDSMAIPQTGGSGDLLDTLKEEVLVMLLPVMTAVYANAKAVLAVETSTGLTPGPGAYSSRVWTLQECLMNPNLGVIPLDPCVPWSWASTSEREKLSGLSSHDDGPRVRSISDIATYTWVLGGQEAKAAHDVPTDARRGFAALATSRSGACASDKGIALGQPYFKLLFPGSWECTRFFQELACLCANDRTPETSQQAPLFLIDNTGWSRESMTGSAAPTRIFAGRADCLWLSGAIEFWDAEVLCSSWDDAEAFVSLGDGDDSKDESTWNYAIDPSDSIRSRGEGLIMAEHYGASGADCPEEVEEPWILCLADVGLPGRKTLPVAFQMFRGSVSSHDRGTSTAVLKSMRTLTTREYMELLEGPRQAQRFCWM